MSGLQLRFGATTRGVHPNEVNPLTAIEVPSVTLSLNEDASNFDSSDSTARWKIRIEAKTTTSRKTLGTLITIPPMISRDSNRIIGLATVPGAIQWDIQGELVNGTGNENSLALLDVASSPCCGSLGLVNTSFAILVPEPLLLYSSAVGPNPLVLPAGVQLLSLTARADVAGGNFTMITSNGTFTIPIAANDSFDGNFGGKVIGPATIAFDGGILHWVVETSP
jgi:hypothetical protein